MCLKVVEQNKKRDIIIKEGEVKVQLMIQYLVIIIGLLFRYFFYQDVYHIHPIVMKIQ